MNSGDNVVRHDTEAPLEAMFRPPDGPRLPDIEQSE